MISDYTPELEVFDYPPICGYPVQVDNKGTEFYATFSSSGAFDILARLRDSQGRTIVVKPQSQGGTSENYVEGPEIVNAPKDFKLTFDSMENLWRGDFPQGSTETITITFKFHIEGLVYTRTLYLLSK